MRNARVAGGVVVHRPTGRIAVVSQNGDSWSLPKGHVETGEDDLTAARREIAEETGLEAITFVRALGEYERFRIGRGGVGDDTGECKTLVFFLFVTDEETLAPRDVVNPEARWIAPDEVAKTLTHAKDAEFFESVRGALSV